MIHDQDQNRYGSGRFADSVEIRNAGLYKGRGVFLGYCPYRKIPLYLDGDSPMIMIAGSGGGKFRDILAYTATYNSSILALDTKGELAAISSQAHRKQGKTVYCINPAGLHTASPWGLPMNGLNPLDILTPDSPTLTADCSIIMEMLIKTTGGKSEYFELKARAYCSALLKYLVIVLGGVTLPEFYTLLNMVESNPLRFEEIAQNELLNFPAEDVQRTAGEMLYKRKNAAGEFSGIMGTVFANLAFLDDPALSQCLGTPDFSLSVLGDPQKSVIFLIVPPEYIGVWSSFLRLVIGVGMIYKQRKPATKVLLLADEIAQLGKFELLERAVTLGRGYGLKAFTIWQDIGQIQNLYGQAGVSSFIGSSQVRQFFAVRDYATAELISKMLGNQTLEYDDLGKQAEAQKSRRHVVNAMLNGSDPFQSGMDAAHFARESHRKSVIQRAVLTPDEIMNMPENKQILFISGVNSRPVYADKMPYFESKIMRGAFLPSPYHLVETRKRRFAFF